MSTIKLTTSIEKDKHIEYVMKSFDLNDSHFSTEIEDNIILPDQWNVGLIYGPSGAGKSTLLSKFGDIKNDALDYEKTIISQLFDDTAQSAKLLSSIGLNSIPSWIKPIKVLSNGEKFRASLAKILSSNKDLYLIDEFTSVVDRNVAKTCSATLSKYVRNNNKRIILCSCHEDIIEWLNPDWIYNPIIGKTIYPRGQLHRPSIQLQIERTSYKSWKFFKQHHYLNDEINKSCRCFTVWWEDKLIGFQSILALPHPTVKNAWRESRMVILPDFQGLSLGCKVSDYFGAMISARSGIFYSRTQNPAMINYRMKSNNWEFLYGGVRKRTNLLEDCKMATSWKADFIREAYSFKYVGPHSSEEESRLFWEK